MTTEAPSAPEEAPAEQLTDYERERLESIIESPQFITQLKGFVRERLEQEEYLSVSDLQWLREFITLWRGV